MQSQTHTFIVNGSAQPCLQAGSGEPLLLIHGALANHTLWLEHIELLSQHYSVYAPTCATLARRAERGRLVLRPMPAICLPCWNSCLAGQCIWRAGHTGRMSP